MKYQRRPARASLSRARPSRWLVVVEYADEQGTTDVIGCSSYSQALAVLSAARLQIKDGGVVNVALLDSEKRVLFDSLNDPEFETWSHIPSPGNYLFDTEKDCLVPRAM